MTGEIYSNRSIIITIKDESVELKYFGVSYVSEHKEDIVATLASILNTIEGNTLNVYKDVLDIINIMEPIPKKILKFDGVKYIAC